MGNEKKLNEKIGELIELLKQEMPPTTTSVNLFINCDGFQATITDRKPDDLKKEGISMRNIQGDFINLSSVK